ncbi:MAG: FixH family protein [Wolinella sp.]
MPQKNLWPLGITLVTLTVVGMIIWTVTLALKNPVELENAYMDNYQNVDLNINEIIQAQKHFFSLYAPSIQKLELSESNDRISVHLVKKSDSTPVSDAHITLRLTRPHTTREDIDLGTIDEMRNGLYISKAISFPSKGRWKIQTTISTDDAHGYFEQELYIR